VRAASGQSFVMAAVPGLIEGAAEGAGLGTRFLKHLGRTRLLIHVVDAAWIYEDRSLADGVQRLEAELAAAGDGFSELPRWLAVNKIDLLPDDQQNSVLESLVSELDWSGPAFAISGEAQLGTERLARAIMTHLDGEAPAGETA